MFFRKFASNRNENNNNNNNKSKKNEEASISSLSIQISKTLMYGFWYDYIKPEYKCNAKLCYMDTDSFIIHIKTEDVYEDIANDVKKDLYMKL